ncbi:cyclic pyranopterin monophosphate synthase MoaC [Engelhardtia mirabilis]|uniref:cyclic pyranopterin monophosphate synthase n=1 Tax=Engelhardtia mirabilis TaxID=2528011 RepID=A0A518BKB0_9BACT|nr:Cyclic pyranopterin monophosphate synthase accessory protein 2 [Planctomycetes bacterium Pla133]QDV01735.1 Cyclic pyranopterin monophosphate synthase accessory protein 2 [Planctomycetes bacterium Pla86]
MSQTDSTAQPDPQNIAPEASAGELSHLRSGPDGTTSQMVDVGSKPSTDRRALARAAVDFPLGRLDQVLARGGPKGPVEEVARVAGILAAKRTPELIPMCHSLGLDHVEVEFERAGPDRLEIYCSAACRGRTGVEMEAMTGAALAALTVYDMVKGLDKGVRLAGVELLEKSGGRSGNWSRPGWNGRAPVTTGE